jgi:hypothetical protein
MPDVRRSVTAVDRGGIRVFHGQLPKLLTVEQARELIDALQRAIADAGARAVNKEAK